MAEFKVLVEDKEYTLEFVRDSVRQFESLGGNIQDFQGKIYTTIDILFFCGLKKHHKEINFNLSKKISDKAIEEYGAEEIFPVLIEKFTEVMMGAKESNKSFLVSEIKTPKK